jgi:hypothetical protein
MINYYLNILKQYLPDPKKDSELDKTFHGLESLDSEIKNQFYTLLDMYKTLREKAVNECGKNFQEETDKLKLEISNIKKDFDDVVVPGICDKCLGEGEYWDTDEEILDTCTMCKGTGQCVKEIK